MTLIHYTIAMCPHGRMLLAATDRGICAVQVGDDDAELEASLRGEYPTSPIERNDERLQARVDDLLRHLAGEEPSLNLPLDVKGTGFQLRVWKELCAIPYGSTRSYTEVARAIGRPKAVRAVARACATNPVWVVIPCHRVIRSDGSLGGYGGGLHRKKALLERERQAALADGPSGNARKRNVGEFALCGAGEELIIT